MNLSNLAIAVPVYIPNAESPRAQYFKRHLEHLKKACRLWPVRFFVDGGDVDLAEKLIKETRLPNYSISHNENNIGLGLNLYHARRLCFEELDHDLVYLLESDIIVTPEIVQLLANVLEWSQREISSPSVASSCVGCHGMNPNAVISNLASWTNYLMPKEAWKMIAPAFKKYAEFLSGVPYNMRPTKAIQQWIEDRFGMPNEATAQDNINRILCFKHGIPVWSLARNRALHIGEFGEHSNPKINWQLARELLPSSNDRAPVAGFIRVGLEGRPWIAKSAVEFLDEKLTEDKPSLFEWGAGNSTGWYAARCEKVWSLEHNEEWFRKVGQDLPDNAQLAFVPLGPMYWNAIAGFEPEMVVIDGRHRKRCAESVSKLKTKPAVVLWDDAQRDWYQCCMPLFAEYKQVDFQCVENKDRITRIFIHPDGKLKHWLI